MVNYFYSDAVNIGMILLSVGGVVFFYANLAMRAKAQTRYEEAFLAGHREFINRYDYNPTHTVIPLGFSRRESDYLLRLCNRSWRTWIHQYYVNIWYTGTSQPSVQTHHIGFRRIEQARSIQIEMIRCNESIALVGAGDGYSGYVLEIDNSEERIYRNYTLFYIYTKFYPRERVELPMDDITAPDTHQSPNDNHTDVTFHPV